MSDNAKCDRCGGDTGRPCPSRGMKDAAIPEDTVIDTAHGGKKTLTFQRHLHLCRACIVSLKEWFNLGKEQCSK